MLRILAMAIGVLFVAMGIMGFIPDFKVNGKLFTLFANNMGVNIIYIITGVIGLLCGLQSIGWSRFFFIASALLYASLSTSHWYWGSEMTFGMIAVNSASSWLYVALSALFLYFAFVI